MAKKCKIGDRVYLIDNLGDGEILICTDIVTAILIEKDLVSVRCKTSGNEFWALGQNAFFDEKELNERLNNKRNKENEKI